MADNSEEMEPDRIRPAILILPGGGYAMTSDREAEPVENTLMLIQACRAVGVSIEAHLFPEGSHGLSRPMRKPLATASMRTSSNACSVGLIWLKPGCVACSRQNAITLCAKCATQLWNNSNRMHRQQLRRCP